MEDLGGETQRWRPNAGPIWITVAVNALLALVLLGAPFMRGRSRSEESRAHFAAFAACLFDGHARSGGGLGLPRGERARFATMGLEGPADWPERCEAELSRVAPEEATFVFPSVKEAESRLRAAVALEQDELRALARARNARVLVVPQRPLRALERMRAALAEQASAAGFEIVVTEEAIDLGDRRDVPTPSIVPLRIATGGAWAARADGDALFVTAIDSRGVGRTRAHDGQVDLRVARRTALASALVDSPEGPWVVFSTPDAQCSREAQGCARRAMGLTPFVEDRQHLRPRAWLGAHPALDPARAVHVEGRLAWIVAEDESGAQVRRFELPEADAQEPPRLEAQLSLQIGFTPESVAWLTGPRLVAVDRDHAVLLDLAPLRATAEAIAGPIEVPRGAAALASCGDWLAIATEHGSVVARPPIVHAIPALSARPALPESLRLVCHAGGVDVWSVADRTLRRATCSTEACTESAVIAANVARFDAVRLGDHRVVALSDSDLESAVRVVVDEGREHVPAACLSPEEGLCGEPRLASDGTRVWLVARQGADLRVLESDDGVAWRGLAGLAQP